MLPSVKSSRSFVTGLLLVLLPVSQAIRHLVLVDPLDRDTKATGQAMHAFTKAAGFSLTLRSDENSATPNRCSLSQCDCIRWYLSVLRGNTVVYMNHDKEPCFKSPSVTDSLYEVMVENSVPQLTTNKGETLSDWKSIALYIAEDAPVLGSPFTTSYFLPVWAIVLIVIFLACITAAIGVFVWKKMEESGQLKRRLTPRSPVSARSSSSASCISPPKDESPKKHTTSSVDETKEERSDRSPDKPKYRESSQVPSAKIKTKHADSSSKKHHKGGKKKKKPHHSPTKK